MRTMRSRLAVSLAAGVALIAFGFAAWTMTTGADVVAGEYSLEVNIDETQAEIGEPFTVKVGVYSDGAASYTAVQWFVEYDETIVSVVPSSEFSKEPGAASQCSSKSNNWTRVLLGCIDLTGPNITYSGNVWNVTARCMLGGRAPFTIFGPDVNTFVKVGAVVQPAHFHSDSIECVGGPTVTPSPSATSTPESTFTPEPTSTNTPAPTVTPGGPTLTPTSTATSTPPPTATSTPTSTPTPRPTPEPVVYPRPTGNCTMTVSSTTAAPGSTVAVSVLVLDANGQPAYGVLPDFSISSQPGSDAVFNLTIPNYGTDPNGIVTGSLFVGSTPGTVVLSAGCASASVIVEAPGG